MSIRITLQDNKLSVFTKQTNLWVGEGRPGRTPGDPEFPPCARRCSSASPQSGSSSFFLAGCRCRYRYWPRFKQISPSRLSNASSDCVTSSSEVSDIRHHFSSSFPLLKQSRGHFSRFSIPQSISILSNPLNPLLILSNSFW